MNINLFTIFAGGALGALIRYSILLFFNPYPINVVGVFIVNLTGCFLIGFFTYLAVKRYNILSKNLKNFLIVGQLTQYPAGEIPQGIVQLY